MHGDVVHLAADAPAPRSAAMTSARVDAGGVEVDQDARRGAAPGRSPAGGATARTIGAQRASSASSSAWPARGGARRTASSLASWLEAQRAEHVGQAIVEAERLHLVGPGLRRRGGVSNGGGSRTMPWLRKRRSRSASAASLVVTMPPSPVVMVLTGWKEKQAMAAVAAVADPLGDVAEGHGRAERVAGVLDQRGAGVGQAPASAGRSAASPRQVHRQHGRAAGGRPAAVSASASVSGVIRPVSGSTSANTTSAPT